MPLWSCIGDPQFGLSLRMEGHRTKVRRHLRFLRSSFIITREGNVLRSEKTSFIEWRGVSHRRRSMESVMSTSSVHLHFPSPNSRSHKNCSSFRRLREIRPFYKVHAIFHRGSVSPAASLKESSTSADNVHRRKSRLESLLCYDKTIPEEKIEKPIGLALAGKIIGNNPCCTACDAKGAVLCRTCSGSGLYVDSILESQGIIVKVRCLGCGGTGNNMCTECGGRGHL